AHGGCVCGADVPVVGLHVAGIGAGIDRGISRDVLIEFEIHGRAFGSAYFFLKRPQNWGKLRAWRARRSSRDWSAGGASGGDFWVTPEMKTRSGKMWALR